MIESANHVLHIRCSPYWANRVGGGYMYIDYNLSKNTNVILMKKKYKH